MRSAALWMLALGCGFQHGTPADVVDATPEPDTTPVTWTVDVASGKACPADAAEWTDFIAARRLAIVVPDSLWLMQEDTGALTDSIGTVHLAPFSVATYRTSVAGWSRLAISTHDGSAARFSNTSAPNLPQVSTTSMTVLMVFASASPPAVNRSVLFEGCCNGYAKLDLDPLNRFQFVVNSVNASGSVDHGADPIPVVMKLDVSGGRQVVITHREVIAAPYTQLSDSRGIFIGGANQLAPDGRWLYMAAWYGANAEMDDGVIHELLTALGW
jgi:hypothetical protein